MSKRKIIETLEQRLARLRASGLKGGLTTKQRMLANNPYYFEELGAIGGSKLAAARGSEYYSALGRLGSAARIARKMKSMSK